MGNKWRGFLLLAVICILSIFPMTALAEEVSYDLNQNKTVTILEQDSYTASGKYAWIKYVPSSDGYLVLKAATPPDAFAPSKGHLALYNNTRSTVLSSKSIFYNTQHSNNPYWYEITFGLKQGQTYYIRVKADNAVMFSRTFTATKKKAGDTRTNAKKIKKNKKKIGLIPAGVVTADWYKIKLTKAQRLRLYYNAKTSGSFKITIYSTKQQIGSQNIYYTSGQKKFTLYQYSKTSKKAAGLDAGTYYVKIERTNASSSGYYEFKWR